MPQIRKIFRSSIRERRNLIYISFAIVICMIVAFVTIVISANRIVDSSKSMIHSQIGHVNSSLERSFSNYYDLSSIIGVDQSIAEFSTLSVDTNADVMMAMGWKIMKNLSAQASIYGEDINNLAVYFPESDSVVTMSRVLLKDEVHLFFITLRMSVFAASEKIPWEPVIIWIMQKPEEITQ